MTKKRGKKSKIDAAAVPVQQKAIEGISPTPFNAPNVLKICRLCECKSGPFMNVFGDPELGLAKKVEDLLPFVIKEDDELPHRICFRCTAKIEELHEFVQKCIASQDNLEKMFGKENTLELKPKPAKRKWEETISKTQKLKSELCDTIIKKAMERMKVLRPTLELDVDKNVFLDAQKNTSSNAQDNSLNAQNTSSNPQKSSSVHAKNQNGSLVNQSSQKIEIEILDVDNDDVEIIGRQYKTRSGITNKTTPTVIPVKSTPVKEVKNLNKSSLQQTQPKVLENIPKQSKTKIQAKESTKTTEFKVVEENNSFNIMDHVNIIKVNGVGTLFQCKFCNRNFLSRESIISHGCAKNGLKEYAEQTESQNMSNTGPKPKPGPARFKQYSSGPQTSSIVRLQSDPNDTTTVSPSSNSKALTIKKVNSKKPEETQAAPANNEPYPVGLFTSSMTMTPAMKKQSYQVLQTSNPNKLLISNKVQQAGPKPERDFTFINVDPINQPSYVLPTDSGVQEPRISTSDTDPNKLYKCHICNLLFSREKKMLTHLQDHYNKLDDDMDQFVGRRNTRSK